MTPDPTPLATAATAAAAAWPAIWLADLLRYLIAAGLLAVLLAALPAGWLTPRSVRIRQVADGQRRQEIWRSMVTVLVFSWTGTTVMAGAMAGVLQIYADPWQYGTVWLAASLGVMLVLHDTWFYWTHRLMHRPALFGVMHRAHHRSVAPTVWAAYSFSPAEALVQAMYLPVVLLAVPLHPVVVFAWMTLMIVRNVMGHSGTELMPRAWLAGWWGRWCTTTLHHDMHHAHGHHNYALYFTWWDRLCNTEHPQYRAQLQALVDRLPAPRPAAAVLKTLAVTVLVATAAAALPRSAAAADILGEWATQGYSARVLVRPCADAPDRVCGAITWLWEPTDAAGRPVTDSRHPDPARRDKPLVGLDMLHGFRPGATPGTWADGRIYNPEDGRTYGATLKLRTPELLEVQGCVLMFCARQVWRRLPLR